MAGIVVLAVSGCATSTSPDVARATSPLASPTSAPVSVPTSPAPTSARSGAVTKVLVFIEENHSLSEMRSGMPYAFGLASRFGYATGYTSIGHPSLPNYVAIAGGQTYGITDDAQPSHNPIAGTSVFGQALASGKTAAVYADGMPQSCATNNGGSGYAVRHNPWAYFINERDICQRYDVPVDRLSMAVDRGVLPNVGMVIPNVCNDAHGCPLAMADAWFKGWMSRIFDGPDWRSGHLAVVLTADEGDRSSERNEVLTVVIHPSQHANVVTAPLTHYSLTRLFEEVAGTPFLFKAASAPSMAEAFGLPTR
ncbi:MAG: alkaline phosphatase family protein [Actinomycetota bacterium]